MTMFNRRTLMQGGTALAATGALAAPALLGWAKAWAQTAPWKPEKGAQLSLLRWKYFVQSEDDSFMALLDAFTKATGVKVTITRESFEDIPPKASVAAIPCSTSTARRSATGETPRATDGAFRVARANPGGLDCGHGPQHPNRIAGECDNSKSR